MEREGKWRERREREGGRGERVGEGWSKEGSEGVMERGKRWKEGKKCVREGGRNYWYLHYRNISQKLLHSKAYELVHPLLDLK